MRGLDEESVPPKSRKGGKARGLEVPRISVGTEGAQEKKKKKFKRKIIKLGLGVCEV